METRSFQNALVKIVTFFETENVPYFVLGGLAVGVMGDARFTYDIDMTVLLKEDDAAILLKRLKKASFQFDPKEAMLSIEHFGSFRFFYKKVQIDVILASTKLEEEAMKRKKKISFLGQPVFFCSPEDLILFKLIAGRQKDISDAESIAIRHKNKLNKVYLKKWAKNLFKESQSPRVLDELTRILLLK